MPHVSQRLTRRTGRVKRAGFTLPEMLIVIVLISLLAIVAIPRFATANGKRHMQSGRMRIGAALATARQAAIQKGQTVRFKISNNRVTVHVPSTSVQLLSPVPLDTLYSITVSNVANPLIVDFSARGFANLSAQTVIRLSRPNTPDDSVIVSSTGMVLR